MTDHTRRKRTAREQTGSVMLWKDIRRNSELTFWPLRYLSKKLLGYNSSIWPQGSSIKKQKQLLDHCWYKCASLPCVFWCWSVPTVRDLLFHLTISVLSSTARTPSPHLPPLHNSAKTLSGELGRSQSSVFLGGLSGLWVPDHRSLMALQKATRRSIFR